MLKASISKLKASNSRLKTPNTVLITPIENLKTEITPKLTQNTIFTLPGGFFKKPPPYPQKTFALMNYKITLLTLILTRGLF